MPYLIGVIYHIILRYLKIHPKKIFSKNDMNTKGLIDYKIFGTLLRINLYYQIGNLFSQSMS